MDLQHHRLALPAQNRDAEGRGIHCVRDTIILAFSRVATSVFLPILFLAMFLPAPSYFDQLLGSTPSG